MSGSRVRENRMHGLKGGRWRSGVTLRETDEKPTGQRPVPAATTNSQRPTTLVVCRVLVG